MMQGPDRLERLYVVISATADGAATMTLTALPPEIGDDTKAVLMVPGALPNGRPVTIALSTNPTT